MRLQRNGGKMLITNKAEVVSYKPRVWFEKKSITNLINLKNLIKHYRVTYESLEYMFIFHQAEHGKDNMNFRIHESGIH